MIRALTDRTTRLLVLVLAVAGLVASVAVPAGAADNGRWSVFPTTVPGQLARPYFQPLLTPGVPVNDSVTITNKTDAPLNVELYTADAFNTEQGGYASRPPNEPKREMGAWITLSASAVTVVPHSAADVQFTITPPLDATPGDHAGSIVAVNTEASVSRNGSVNIRAIDAVGTRVYGRVSGPLTRSLEVTSLDVGTSSGVSGLFGGPVDVDVTYKVVNTGNVRLSPRAKLSVSPLIGGSTDAKPTALPELLPHGSAVIHQHVSGVLPFGKVTAKVEVTSAAPTATAESTAFVIPWLLLLLLLALGLAIWGWRRRRRHRDEGAVAWAELDEVKVP